MRAIHHPALAGVRIGCVQYLNAQPLIHTAAEAVELRHPRVLARELAAGELDAGLVPIFEVLGERSYLIVDGVAIASDGPVYSVFLAWKGELEAVRRVFLDPASLTSVHLVQVLLAEGYGLKPEYVDEALGGGFGEGEDGGKSAARLLIGNQAIEFRREMDPEWRIMDLGAEWQRLFGLPFVYAVWALREDLADAPAVAEAFRALKREGLAARDDVVTAQPVEAREFARRYLTEHIRFELGEREKAGIEKFGSLLRAAGLVAAPERSLRYV